MVTLLVTSNHKSTRISTFCIAFHILTVGEHRDFKFGVQVDHNKSQPMVNKLSQKGAWSHHVTHWSCTWPILVP